MRSRRRISGRKKTVTKEDGDPTKRRSLKRARNVFRKSARPTLLAFIAISVVTFFCNRLQSKEEWLRKGLRSPVEAPSLSKVYLKGVKSRFVAPPVFQGQPLNAAHKDLKEKTRFQDSGNGTDTVAEESSPDVDQYYAFDDDYIRSSYLAYDDDSIQDEKRCRRVSWHRLHFPTCNSMHELGARNITDKVVSYGGFYDTFEMTFRNLNKDETFAFKQLRYKWDGTYDNYEAIRMDALVSERLTSHFRIVDVYGHCGLSVLATYMNSGDLDQVFTGDSSGESEVFDSGVDPYNKLLVVTEASHALAALHGYQDGVIVHGDFSLCQLLFDESGAVQLDDFNRAEILLFDEDSGAYCKFQNGEGFSARAPEEYMLKPIDDSADVYSFGAIIYNILMGSYLESDERKIEDYEDFETTVWNRDVRKATTLLEGTHPAYDCLLNVMKKSLQFEPTNRPSMAEIVRVLEGCVKSVDEVPSVHPPGP